MKSAIRYLLLVAILILGAGLRFWDSNWDQGFHLHPDERFLTMVANDAKVPDTFSEYIDPTRSTLSPYNIGKSYFTYGAFPVALTKVVAGMFEMDNYDDLVIVGRRLAALFDTATILFVFLLASRMFTKNVGLAAALVYALTVLAIQHGHFLVVDPFAVSFFMLALVLLYCNGTPLFAGLAFGAALGCKVSLVLQAPVLLALATMRTRRLRHLLTQLLLLALGAYLGLRFADPKFFTSASWLNPWVNPQFIENLRELKRLSDYSLHPWPPGVQWLSKTPILFTIQNFILFGFGLVATWLAIWGAWDHRKMHRVWFLALWCCLFMLYSGTQFLQTMRYVYPVYPLAAILAGLGFTAILRQYQRARWVICCALVLLLAIWPAAFMNIYRGEHSRVEASRWIFENLARDSKIGVEHWDDSLPLQLPGKEFNFEFIELPVFEGDSPEKLAVLRKKASEVDAIVFSSNRGWGSIMPLTKQFPLTISWYRELFAGSGDFVESYRVSRRPSLFGFEISEYLADEAFSVYDHPEVIVFTRK